MPRLTVDPQVKPSKAPTGAGSKQSLPGNTGASLSAEQVPRAPWLPQRPNIGASPHLWGATQVGGLLFPYMGDTGSREQPGESIWLIWEVHSGAGPRREVAGSPHRGTLLSSHPGCWLRFEESQPGCRMISEVMKHLFLPFPLSQHTCFSICPGEPRPHLTSSFVCPVSLLFCLVLSLHRDTDALMGFGFAVKSLGLLSHRSPGVSAGVTCCGTLVGREEEGRLCLMGFLTIWQRGRQSEGGDGSKKGTV